MKPERIESILNRAQMARAYAGSCGGLINQTEIAKRAGTNVSTVSRWATWPGFPRPFHVGGQEKLWLADEVEVWARRRHRAWDTP